MSPGPRDHRVQLAAHPVRWTLARLARYGGPVLRIPGVGLVVNDAEVAHDVLSRDSEFVKCGRGGFADNITQLLGPFALANMDGDEHRRLRGMLGDLLSPANAVLLLHSYDAPLEALRARLAAGETVDLVRFMRIMSGRLTFDMMGVRPPGEDADVAALAVVALGDRLSTALRARPLAQRAQRAWQDSVDQLAAFARAGYDAADAPDSSLVKRLRDRGLSFEEAKGVLMMFFLGGTLTTSAALPRIVSLLVDSGQMAQLRVRPAQIPQAIAEGLRYITPLLASIRIASRATRLGARTVRAGERIVILVCNTARDRKLFPDPDRFDISRVHDPRARHLWYGSGPHFCFGFALAQRELHAVLALLATAPGTLRIVRRRAARGVLLPAFARLDVSLDSEEP
ncbi:MAG: cytochrome P450 [Gemmatimonadota bacterium]